ncbi:MAG: phage shock protein A [Candidatus Azotimanducaceae bacterium]
MNTVHFLLEQRSHLVHIAIVNTVQLTKDTTMIKQLLTLARGRSADASQAFLDVNAVSLLRQQLRDAANSVDKSRKAVAVVMAYAEREKVSLVRVKSQISDLEARTLEALAKDREDLAIEAATSIANLEAERDATQKTIDTYASEIVRLRKDLSQSEAVLAELKRGQRIAEATAKTQRVRGDAPKTSQNDLSDASVTLKRLQERQQHADATLSALTELSVSDQAETLTERLAAAGIGMSEKTSAADVLARLKKAKI